MVFAINKMDLVGYDETRFKAIKREIKAFCAEFDFDSIYAVPVSATEGDFINKPSNKMQWFKGQALLSYLEEIEVNKATEDDDFVLPIQRVCRPNHTFRGFQGQISNGIIHVGDEIIALPSKETAKVKEIYNTDKKVEQAVMGQAVTVQLDREVDVSRGCVLCSSDKLKVSTVFTSKILWMDDTKLVAGKNYLLKIGTKSIPAVVMNLKHKIDVNTGDLIPTDHLNKNEIGLCDISVSDKIIYDTFQHNKDMGSFILIDRISHMTSACGIIEHSLRRGDNVIWQDTDITRDLRAQQKSQSPVTLWFTGLSGSGKSTLANALEKRLFALGKHTMLLDGDNIRMGLNNNLGFKEQDRIENIRRVSEVCKLMNDAGLIALTSFISPFESVRSNARSIIGENNYIEIYVSTPLEVCEERDVKGLYKKARAGEIPNFSGINSPYEVPSNPRITIDTANKTIEECVDYILEELKDLL